MQVNLDPFRVSLRHALTIPGHTLTIAKRDDWRKSFFCEFPKVIFSVTRVCFFAGRHEDLGPEYSTEALSQKFAVALSKSRRQLSLLSTKTLG